MTNRSIVSVCEQLLAPIMDETNPAVAEQIVRHMATCDRCRDDEGMLLEMLARYRAQPVPPLSPSLERRLLQACLKCFNDNLRLEEPTALSLEGEGVNPRGFSPGI